MRANAVLKDSSKLSSFVNNLSTKKSNAFESEHNNSRQNGNSDFSFSQQPVFNYTTGFPLGIQPKLTINEPGDKYEQEADAMADKIMRMSMPDKEIHPNSTPGIQRKCAHCEEEEKKKLQRKESNTQSAPTSHTLRSYVNGLNNSGQPLSKELRNFYEPRFGYDFSKVRIHDDAAASQSAQSINALAYTHGNNIVFKSGQYSPQSITGKRLLGHELAHVVQQSGFSSEKIQRDAKSDETEALINFKNDWQNNFTKYEKLLTISSKVYSQSQKEGIIAVKTEGGIEITFGKPYATLDEFERWLLIKTEIIDKFSGADRFEDVAYDPTHSKIKEINPPYRAGQYCSLNCPATAASLDEYLRTGKVNKAYCNPMEEGGSGYGFDISKNTFSKTYSWKQAAGVIKKKLAKHGDFIVVEATRSAKQMKDENLAENHYFTVVNIKGKLFAIDAFGGGIVNDDINAYITNSIKATTYRLVEGQFTVKVVRLP